MPNDHLEYDFPEKEPVPPVGNSIIQKIVLYPGEGLIIKWVRQDFIPTMIDMEGVQKPLFDFVINHFPKLEDATGRGLYIVATPNGSPVEIGQIGGGDHVSIEKELRRLGLID